MLLQLQQTRQLVLWSPKRVFSLHRNATALFSRRSAIAGRTVSSDSPSAGYPKRPTVKLAALDQNPLIAYFFQYLSSIYWAPWPSG